MMSSLIGVGNDYYDVVLQNCFGDLYHVNYDPDGGI